MSGLVKAGLLRFKPMPALDELAHGIAPHEFKVLVLPREVEKLSAGGLELPEEYLDREQEAAVDGMLVALSPAAYSYAEWPDDAAKPAPGAIVLFARYAGLMVTGADGRRYRLMNDKDVIAVRTSAPDVLEGAWR